MTFRQFRFCEEYLSGMAEGKSNVSAAARRAGYAGAGGVLHTSAVRGMLRAAMIRRRLDLSRFLGTLEGGLDAVRPSTAAPESPDLPDSPTPSAPEPDWSIRHRYLETGLKLLLHGGLFAPPEEPPGPQTITIIYGHLTTPPSPPAPSTVCSDAPETTPDSDS